MAKKNTPPKQSEDFLNSEYYQSILSNHRMQQYLSNPENSQVVSPLQAALLEANGGLVLGGKRDKDGKLIIETDETKQRLRG